MSESSKKVWLIVIRCLKMFVSLIEAELKEQPKDHVEKI